MHDYPCYVYMVSAGDTRRHADELVDQCTAIEWGYAEKPIESGD